MFCFGDEAIAKTAAAAAASSTSQPTDLPDSAKPDNKQRSHNTLEAVQKSQEPSDEDSLLSAKQSTSQEDLQLAASASTQPIAEAEQATRSPTEEAEGSASRVDTSDEEASGSDSASERLWDMTPQQLQDLKVTC